MPRRHWLMKSEPESFSIQHLARAKDQTTFWDGVRNYQARNLLRDEIAVGDGVLFYHSNADPPAVAGTCTVVRAGYPDPSQFDPKSDYHDPESKRDDPRWFVVDVKLDTIFSRPVPLDELRATPGLEAMVLLRKGSRLSVQPVTPDEWTIITALGATAAAPARKPTASKPDRAEKKQPKKKQPKKKQPKK